MAPTESDTARLVASDELREREALEQECGGGTESWKQ